MRFKILLELKPNDYMRMKDFFSANPSAQLELFPCEDFEFAAISPLVITSEGFGYSITSIVSFQQPIGLDVFNHLKLDNETASWLSVNYRNIKLSKTVTEKTEIESNLNNCSVLLERIINQTCNMNDKLIEKTFTINTEILDKQLDLIIRTEELEKRGEVARPFGLIHAKSRTDAGTRVGKDLIPIFIENDKAYLYEDKKVFVILPRDFVMKLLKMDNSTLLPSDHFTDEENDLLRKFSMRKYIKTMKVDGKPVYYSLNEKTRKLLLKGMKKL